MNCEAGSEFGIRPACGLDFDIGGRALKCRAYSQPGQEVDSLKIDS